MAGPILTIDVQGGAQLIAKLGRAVASEVLAVPLRKGAERLRSAMQHYPPPPATSTYERTGNLGQSWTEPRLTGLTAEISEHVRGPSGAAYGPFVQGARDQTKAHAATGWLTDEGAIRQEAPAIEQDFKDAIQSALR